MGLNDAWLDQVQEEALEPDLPILDPHHHLWDYPERNNTYLLPDLIADTKDHNVRSTVFIECGAMYRPDGPAEFMPVGETEFVQGVAAASASGNYGSFRGCAGIVGTADLRLGDFVVPILEAQVAASPNRFRGIRHRAAWPENRPRPGQPAGKEHLYLDPDFRKGFAKLRLFGLSFEAWLYDNQLPDVVDLAQSFPDTTIILNHLGGPLLSPERPKEQVFPQWRRNIAAIAACPNVVVKLGGIQMPVNGFGWEKREKPPTSDELVDENSDWYSYAIDQFGPSRSMFESNFPVDRASCSYTVLYNSFKKMSYGFREDERIALFHDTAARVYRLPLASESN